MVLGPISKIDDLKISFQPPEGWIQHPEDYMWRPEEDIPKLFPPTVIIERYQGATMKEALSKIIEGLDSEAEPLERNDTFTNKLPAVYLYYKHKETKFLMLYTIIDHPNGPLSILCYSPAPLWPKHQGIFLKMIESIQFLD